MPDRPNINDRFPFKESLSPPIVASPVPECAEAVYVSGFVPHAIVRVYAGGAEILAEAQPPFGFAEIALKRPVVLGESLTATQTVDSVTSAHSIVPVIVSALPEGAVKTQKPDVGDDLYQCGIVVPVGNLVPGVRVHVTEDGIEVGSDPVAKDWHPVVTKPLHAAGEVSARQVACEGTDHELIGPWADGVKVKPAPSPVPAPAVDPGSLIAGNDTVTLTGLLVGAGAHIFDHAVQVSTGWYSTGPSNFFPIDSVLTSTSLVTAKQELCGEVSLPSDPVTPTGSLNAPVVVGPICHGAKFVVVRKTVVNAVVVVFRNGSPVAYGGAAPGDVVLALGGNASLATGDVVTALQYMGSTVSPISNAVTVVQYLKQPFVEILGGEPFFAAKSGEEPIDGPVFCRGRLPGPDIRVQACCQKNVHIDVVDPAGKVIATPPLAEVFPGYYTATWPWDSTSGWAVPEGIPVGRYAVVAHTDCDQGSAEASLYVIFDPDQVNGPPRFSFDDTAVWFGTGKNSVYGFHYYLRQSDKRVFSIAANAAKGITDPYEAAIAIARAEEDLFAYSLNYHTNDVLDLVLNFTEAQCADDACCLTSLLRAFGIPAHPTTADAGLETGEAYWTFDTWVEFLAPHGGSTEWRVLHPHEYPGMQPESRSTFGTTRDVAKKSFDDVILMANPAWLGASLDDGLMDASYGRNACSQPEQVIAKPAWIDELCEAGYWSVPHWDCDGVSPMSFQPGDGFRFVESDMAFGGTLAGTINVVNSADDRRFGRFVVELVSHSPGSKAFPEKVFDEVSVPAVLESGQRLTVPFRLQLPETLPPGRDLYLRARLDDRTAHLHRIAIRAAVHCEIDWLQSLSEGDAVRLRALVRNLGEDTLRGVSVHLRIPFALQADDHSQRRLGEILPGEARELEWAVRAIAPLRSGSVQVEVSTANAGGCIARRPLIVAGPLAVIDARPGVSSA